MQDPKRDATRTIFSARVLIPDYVSLPFIGVYSRQNPQAPLSPGEFPPPLSPEEFPPGAFPPAECPPPLRGEPPPIGGDDPLGGASSEGVASLRPASLKPQCAASLNPPCGASLTPLDGGVMLVQIRLVGDGFLKHMVRRIAGLLVRIGAGEEHEEAMAIALVEQGGFDRRRAPEAPAHGLWLESVDVCWAEGGG